ncbi:helix-turn-helix domain-containing protein [Candidatus Poribacteria bacterium]|nr:helix-turn-helix domain-containing protein [Candidatus Poribacteria bacterium]
MWKNYKQLIKESEEELQELEKKHRGKQTYPRVSLLRLLKSGQARSIQKSSQILGYSSKQLYRWWDRYQQGGIEELLHLRKPPGRRSMMTDQAWDGLMHQMRSGKISTLKDARRYLSEEWGIQYKSLNGIWVLLKKHKVKLKRDRRRHRKICAGKRIGGGSGLHMDERRVRQVQG